MQLIYDFEDDYEFEDEDDYEKGRDSPCDPNSLADP
jgi:hypothetical protein